MTEDLSCDISKYEGLIHCRVVPSRKLLHPVLPYRCNGKLMFTLGATCAEQLAQDPCEHNDEDRSLQGTRVSVELKKSTRVELPGGGSV